MRNVSIRVGLILSCLGWSLPSFGGSVPPSMVILRKIVTSPETVTVSYYKTFATCVHLLNEQNQITHINNDYCETYKEISVTLKHSAFKAGMVPQIGQRLKLCHGNNYNICSSLVTVVGVPEISSFSPQESLVGGTVNITGKGFTGATSVKFNGVSAAFSVVSGSQITATVPAGATTGPITVTNQYGTGQSTTGFLLAVVALRSIITDGSSIAVSYFKNFNTCAHLLNENNQIIHVANNYCTSNSETSITQTAADFISGKAPAGGQMLKLCHGNNYNICSPSIRVIGRPRITDLSPSEQMVGATVYIRGEYLGSASSVKFNGVAADFSIGSATELKATVPGGATTGPVVVTTPDGSATSPTPFQVDAINLNDVAVAGNSIKVTYFKNFATCGHIYNANNQIIHSANNYCQTGAITTVNQTASDFLPGLAPATGQKLKICHGNNSGICSSLITVRSILSVTDFSPLYVGVGDKVTINGSGFTGATVVKLGGRNADFTVISDNKIEAITPPDAAPAPVVVGVAGAEASSPTSLNIFRILSVAPKEDFQESMVILNVTPFTSSSPSVRMNGATSNPVFVVNPSQVQARIPLTAAPGNARIEFRDGNKLAVQASGAVLNILPRVVLGSFLPTSGSAGTRVTILGSGFRPDSKVNFGSLAAQNLTVISPTRIEVSAPPGVAAGPITVFHSFGGFGGKATSSLSFQIAAPPVISGFSPTQEAELAVITITGDRFTGASAVSFNGRLAQTFTVVDDETIQATVPAGATTGPIRVTVGNDTVASASPFTVNPLCNPTIVAANELAINSLQVVNDPRTVFKATNLAQSHWSFGYLMGRMAGIAENDPDFVTKTSVFVIEWLRLIGVSGVAENGAAIGPPRSQILQIINSWPRLAPSQNLDFSRAPFRLLAIINRLDLRNDSQAGEGRFVFGVLSPSGGPLQFTVILEYGLPLTQTLTQNAWALKWHELSALPAGSPAHLTKLQEVTDLFSANSFAGKPNGSAINQIRTNEIALASPWELREFRLPAAGGKLVGVTVKQTPVFNLNGSSKLRDWILANQDAVRDGTHVVPGRFDDGAPFLGGTAPMPGGFRWSAPGVPEDVRRSFSLNTCNGCHAGETNTGFLHVGVRSQSGTAFFSSFMQNDILARATGPNGMRNLLIDLNCQ